MIDLSPALEAMVRGRDEPAEERRARLDKASAAVSGVINWDWPDEEWATIVTGDEQSAVEVYMGGPLVITRREYERPVRTALSADVPVIVVDDMYANELRATPESLRRAFGQIVDVVEFDLEGFSANDLWYWTI